MLDKIISLRKCVELLFLHKTKTDRSSCSGGAVYLRSQIAGDRVKEFSVKYGRGSKHCC